MEDAPFLREIKRLSDEQLLAIAQRARKGTLERLRLLCVTPDNCNCMTRGIRCEKCQRVVKGPTCPHCGNELFCYHHGMKAVRPVPAEVEGLILERLNPRGQYDKTTEDDEPMATFSQRATAEGMRRRKAQIRKLGTTAHADLVQAINSADKEKRLKAICVQWYRQRNGRSPYGELTEGDA